MTHAPLNAQQGQPPEDEKRTMLLLALVDANNGKLIISTLSRILIQPTQKTEDRRNVANPLFLRQPHEKVMAPLIAAGYVECKVNIAGYGSYVMLPAGQQALEGLRQAYPSLIPAQEAMTPAPSFAETIKPKAKITKPAHPVTEEPVQNEGFRDALGPYARRLFDAQRKGGNDNAPGHSDDKEMKR